MSNQDSFDKTQTGQMPSLDNGVSGATQRVNVNAAGQPVAPQANSAPARRPSNAAARARATAAKKKKERNIIIAACSAAVLLILVIVILCITIFSKPADDGRILNNVFAAGVNLGGMTTDEAKEALHAATDDTYSRLDMTVQVLDTTLLLAAKDTGASLDVDAVVEVAYNYGRTGSRSEQKQAQKQAQTSTYTISILPYLRLDTGYIQTAIQNLGAQYSTTLTETTYKVDGTRPAITPGPQDVGVTHQTLTIHIGTAEYGLSTTNLYQQVMDAYNINLFEVVGVCTKKAPAALDCEALYKSLCVEPVDAVLDGQTYEITPEIYGYGFSMEELLNAVSSAEYGSVVTIPLKYIAPSITSDFFSEDMFQDVLATYRTPLTADSNWNTNLRIVCEALNGMILKSGEEFSFNQLTGEPTTRNGYRPVNIYVGKSQREIVGGGICQVATTLYNCALLADLDILERHSHSYAPSFVDAGFDAEVYYGNLDFRFRNSTEYPIRIEAKAENGNVLIRFIGTDKKDYSIEISYKVDLTKDPSTVYNTMEENNPGGYQDGDVLSEGIPGSIISVYMTKFDKQTGRQISEELVSMSVYAKLDKVVVKIDKADDPQPPVDPEDPTDPTDPSEPTNPTEPSEPTEPTEPAEPDPSDPGNADQPEGENGEA